MDRLTPSPAPQPNPEQGRSAEQACDRYNAQIKYMYQSRTPSITRTHGSIVLGPKPLFYTPTHSTHELLPHTAPMVIHRENKQDSGPTLILGNVKCYLIRGLTSCEGYLDFLLYTTCIVNIRSQFPIPKNYDPRGDFVPILNRFHKYVWKKWLLSGIDYVTYNGLPQEC